MKRWAMCRTPAAAAAPSAARPARRVAPSSSRPRAAAARSSTSLQEAREVAGEVVERAACRARRRRTGTAPPAARGRCEASPSHARRGRAAGARAPRGTPRPARGRSDGRPPQGSPCRACRDDTPRPERQFGAGARAITSMRSRKSGAHIRSASPTRWAPAPQCAAGRHRVALDAGEVVADAEGLRLRRDVDDLVAVAAAGGSGGWRG